MCKIVHCLHDKFDVYIGRPHPFFPEGSPFFNPYKIGKDGTRNEVLALYEIYLRNSPKLLELIMTLEGKTLGCWCKPKKCHGDVILKLINELNMDKRLFTY